VGFAYEEGGQLAGWLDRAPKLKSLIAPSAPNAAFFERAEHPLQWLRVDAGVDAQDFILHLSQSSCFLYLGHLDFGEVWNFDRETWSETCTPFEHYEALFRSNATGVSHVLTLRNPDLSEEQLAALKALRPEWWVRIIYNSFKSVR
jgi:hypothetical protein